MKLIKPSFEILTPVTTELLKRIELAGRVCYKSEDKTTADSADGFVRRIIGRQHESVLEHASLTVRFICDRGVSHELVRHRLTSVSQESTRYVNYDSRGIEFVIPPWCDIDLENGQALTFGTALWINSMRALDGAYRELLANGWKPEQARSVLPNSLKTEIVMTANMREWRHIMALRTSRAAHPQMRELMVPLLATLAAQLPAVFSDLLPNE